MSAARKRGAEQMVRQSCKAHFHRSEVFRIQCLVVAASVVAASVSCLVDPLEQAWAPRRHGMMIILRTTWRAASSSITTSTTIPTTITTTTTAVVGPQSPQGPAAVAAGEAEVVIGPVAAVLVVAVCQPHLRSMAARAMPPWTTITSAPRGSCGVRRAVGEALVVDGAAAATPPPPLPCAGPTYTDCLVAAQ